MFCNAQTIPWNEAHDDAKHLSPVNPALTMSFYWHRIAVLKNVQLTLQATLMSTA